MSIQVEELIKAYSFIKMKLANQKYKHFSNAGFGDLWYSLYLEEPKVKMQRQQQRMF